MSFSPQVDQGIWHATIWSIVNQICPSILENWFGPILQQIYGRSFTKNPHSGHSKNGKWIFRAKKMKTPLGNIVSNYKMHPCAQYKIIWTYYAMNVAIRLIIWLESHESSRMIAHFWEHFFKIITVLQLLLFFLETCSHIMTQCEGFPIFWFFLIFYARFKMRSKRRAWPFLSSGWILDFFGVSMIK